MKRRPVPQRPPNTRITGYTALIGLALLSAPQAEAMPHFGTSGLNNVDVGNEAKPVLADLDGDGDLDAFIGDWQGRIRYFRNDGTAQIPYFVAASLADNPLADIHVEARAAPVFVDIDGDDDLDLFIGDWEGRIQYFHNSGSARAPQLAAYTAYDPFNKVDVGRFAAPAFIDVDGDGDLDAIVGSWDRGLLYFQNTGLPHRPDFNLVVERDNPFKAFDLGQNLIPAVADVDQDGDDDILVGAWNGRISYIRNGGSARQPLYWPAAGSANPLHRLRAERSIAPALGDIDGDGDLDAFIGHADGSVHYFHNNGRPQQPDIYPTTRQAKSLAALVADTTASRRLAISMSDLDNDGQLDAFINDNGTLRSYRGHHDPAASETETTFVPLKDKQGWIEPSSAPLHTAPVFVDIDADGDLDAFVGGSDGRIYYLHNDGSTNDPKLRWHNSHPLDRVRVDRHASLTLADLDGDSDLDAVIGSRAGPLRYYRNDGSASDPKFVASNEAEGPLMRLEVDGKSSPLLADFDLDGDADLIVSGEDGSLRYFLNQSLERNSHTIARFTPQSHAYDLNDNSGNPLYGLGGGSDAIISSADIDGDGDLDLVLGAIGAIRIIENHDPRPVARDDATLCAVDKFKTTQQVSANDLFKSEAPAADFYIESFDSTSAKGGQVEQGEDFTFDYRPAAGFLGADRFRYTLHNGQGVRASAWVNIKVVVDQEPPLINLPEPFAIEPSNEQGIELDHPALLALLARLHATDAVDGNIQHVAVELPPQLLRGDNPVTLRAEDVSGNQSTLQTVLRIADATPPQVTAPADATFAAPHAGPVANKELELDTFLNAAQAIDQLDGAITHIEHDLPATLPLGETLVTFSARDAAGNIGHASARIFILDQDAPSVTAPDELSLAATNPWGVPANDRRILKFLDSLQASDNVGIDSVRHNAPSHFPVGRTTVRFTVRDAAGNTGRAKADVIVTAKP